MYKENYIPNVEIGNDLTGVVHIRGKCRMSMTTSIYKVTVQLVRDTGMVASGVCTCKPGQSGACAHIGALLLTVIKTR